MCSIFKYGNVVGRNFDYEVSYQEELRVVERGEFDNDYKVIGMCTGLVKDYPLFYDGMNEYGLVCGGLAFTGNAVYNKSTGSLGDVPSWNFVLEILGNCSSVEDAMSFLDFANITDEAYSESMPPSDLHWFIADGDKSIIVEQTVSGLHYYYDDVMTNNPLYRVQKGLSRFITSSIGTFQKPNISRGEETLGLHGDYTSTGRFARLSWLKDKLESSENGFNPVSQGFHLLSSVEQVYGITQVADKFEYTIYSVVYDMDAKSVLLKMYDDLDIKEYEL